MDTPPYLNVLLLGDPYTGKSSLINRFLTDKFSIHYSPTTALTILQKSVKLPQLRDNVNLRFWDIPGSMIHSPSIHNVVALADVILFVYDITQPTTFHALDPWFVNTPTTATKALVGMKSDLAGLRMVSHHAHVQYATDHHLHTHKLVSARISDSIYSLVVDLATFACTGIAVETTTSDVANQLGGGVKSLVRHLSVVSLAPQPSKKRTSSNIKSNVCLLM